MGNSIHHYRSNIIAPSSNNQHLGKPKNTYLLEEVSGVSFASILCGNLEVFQGPLADSGTSLKALLQLGGLRALLRVEVQVGVGTAILWLPLS